MNLSLSAKCLLGLIVAVVLTNTGISILNYYHQKYTLQHSMRNVLTAIRETKKREIETYFSRMKNQMITMAQDLMFVQAAKEFKEAFFAIPKELKVTPQQLAQYKQAIEKQYTDEFLKRLSANVPGEHFIDQYMPINAESLILQYYYIAKNPNPTGSKENLDSANDGSSYSKVHAQYHPLIKNFIKRFGYYDIFIVDPETGYIVYTMFKEIDFANNLQTGPYEKTTNIARIFREALAAGKDSFQFADFEPYDPSYAAPAAFISSPIYEGDKKIAVLMIQIPVEDINNIMTDNKRWTETGFGNTGEAYLVGNDYKMRSVSRVFLEDSQRYLRILEKFGINRHIIDQIRFYQTTILLQEVNSSAAKEALRGNTDITYDENYLNASVLSAYAPLNIPETKWGIIAEIHVSEILSPLYQSLKYIIGLLIVLFVSTVLIGFVSIRKLLQPLYSFIDYLTHFEKQQYSTMSPLPFANNPEVDLLTEQFNKAITSSNKDHATSSHMSFAIEQFLNQYDRSFKSLMHNREIIRAQREKIDQALQNTKEYLFQATQTTQQLDTAYTMLTTLIHDVNRTGQLISLQSKTVTNALHALQKQFGKEASGPMISELCLQAETMTQQSEQLQKEITYAQNNMSQIGTTRSALQTHMHALTEQVHTLVTALNTAAQTVHVIVNDCQEISTALEPLKKIE